MSCEFHLLKQLFSEGTIMPYILGDDVSTQDNTLCRQCSLCKNERSAGVKQTRKKRIQNYLIRNHVLKVSQQQSYLIQTLILSCQASRPFLLPLLLPVYRRGCGPPTTLPPKCRRGVKLCCLPHPPAPPLIYSAPDGVLLNPSFLTTDY